MKRPSLPGTARQRRYALAYFWAFFTVAGITEYFGLWDMPWMKAKIANCIWIIFVASMYANFSTDLDRAETMDE